MRHTLTYYLGGSIPVEADFLVGGNGDIELSDARIGDETIDVLERVGEYRDGKWRKLEDLLTNQARGLVEDWLAEDRARDREFMSP
jgi:hypothetical protein